MCAVYILGPERVGTVAKNGDPGYTTEAPEHTYLEDPAALPEEDRRRMLAVGVDAGDTRRSGTFLQMDHSVVHCGVRQEGLEVMGIDEALAGYPWVQDYVWRALDAAQDEFTAYAQDRSRSGYFIRALPGVKAVYPVQACLYLARERLAQCVHNIVIVEEGAELHIITGCASGQRVMSGLHLGVSEFYVKKNAHLTFTMIHNWAEEMEVRPRTAVIVEEGGVFLSNYICLSPVRLLQTNPVAYLRGEGAVARFNTVLVAPPGSFMDVGSQVFLAAERTRAELIARTVTTGGGIINRGLLVGEKAGVKAHLECRGLLLTSDGYIRAIPELEARVAGAELSHEAAVGKIAPEEIEYLMARGLDEDEATATIVRGFLNVRIEGLPEELERQIDRALEVSKVSAM